MPRYDATTKHLVESAPLDWVALAGYPEVQSARMVDTDLSTVTAQADKVILIEEAVPWIIHIEFQAAHDSGMGLRLCRYNVLLEYQHRIPVLSVLVLLSPDADGSAINGELRRCLPNETCYDEFRYQVIRVWELSVESILTGGLGTLPLAPISGVPQKGLPVIIERIKARVDAEIPSPAARQDFWGTTAILLGMRLPLLSVENLLQRVINMEESSVIQGYLEKGERRGEIKGEIKGVIKGEVKGARKVLLEIGEDALGSADHRTREFIESLTDANFIAKLARRVHHLRTWDELFAEAERLQSSE